MFSGFAHRNAFLFLWLMLECTAFPSTPSSTFTASFLSGAGSKLWHKRRPSHTGHGCCLTRRNLLGNSLQLMMVDAAPVMDAAPVLDSGVPTVGGADAGGTQPTVDLRRPNTATKLVLLSWFLLIVGIPAAYYITGAPPSAHLLPHMLAGSGAGMMAVSLCYPLQQLRAINWQGGLSRSLRLLFTGLGLVLAAQGVLKAISSISYAYFHSIVQSAAVQGISAVAQASLATGVVVGLVSSPLERAQRSRKGKNIVDNLSELAGRGLFSRQGLYGGVGAVIAVNVISFEAFYLSYHCFLAVCPWLGAGMIGTAIAGAASGVVALLAGQLFPKLLELVSKTGDANDAAVASGNAWRRRLSSFGKSASLVALNSSLVFVFYRALFMVLSR